MRSCNKFISVKTTTMVKNFHHLFCDILINRFFNNLKSTSFIGILFLFTLNICFGQTPLALNNFDAGIGTWTRATTGTQNIANATPFSVCSAYPSANKCEILDSYTNVSGKTSTLTTPAFSLVGYLSATLSIDLINIGTNSGFVIQGSIDGGTTWQATNIATNPTTTGSAFVNKTYNLGAPYLGASSIKIRFVLTSNFGSDKCLNDVFIDNGTVTGVVCTAPTTTYSVTAPSGTSYCSGGSGVPIGLSGSQSGVTYQLFLGASTVGSTVAGTGSAISFGNQTAAGVYTVKTTTAGSYCVATMTGSQTITINNSPPALPALIGGTSICTSGSGASTTSLSLSALPTGGTITTSGGYRIHTFTNSGSFVVPAGFSGFVNVLVVGGGGGGGYNGGGGGGGGAVITSTNYNLTSGSSTTVTIGNGGASSQNPPSGGNGQSSSFGTLTASGGGGGATRDNAVAGAQGGVGAGGGGGGGGSTLLASTPGAANGSGGAGGNGTWQWAGPTANTDKGCWSAGGGGGGAGSSAGVAAQDVTNSSVKAGNGGAGLAVSFAGIAGTYGGGGGGNTTGFPACGGTGMTAAMLTQGTGGAGGGGAGNAAGTANTGGGGGAGGAGGSGIVIVSYADITSGAWSTSNSSMATVSAGTVSGATTAGSPVITYTVTNPANSCTSNCSKTITVTNCCIPPTSIALSASNVSICTGGSTVFTPVLTGGSVAGGNWEYQYELSSGGVLQAWSTTSTYSPSAIPAGIYDILVKVRSSSCNTLSTSSNNVVATVADCLAPTITSFTPNSGCATTGTSVTITGANFFGVSGVTINGVSATYVVNSVTSITATLPNAATGVGNIVVTNGSGSVTSGSQFTVNTIATPGTFQHANGSTQYICSGSTISCSNVAAPTNGGSGSLSVVWYCGEEISPGAYGNWIRSSNTAYSLYSAAGGASPSTSLNSYNPQVDFPGKTKFLIIRRGYTDNCGECILNSSGVYLCQDQSFYLNVGSVPAGGSIATVSYCASTGTSAVAVTGVIGANQYTWTLPSGLTGTSTTSSITVNGTIPGNYLLSVLPQFVIGPLTCDATSNVNGSVVVLSSANNPGAVSVTSALCLNGSASITNVTSATTGTPASSGPNYYFYWRRTSAPAVGWTMYDGPTSNTSSALPAAVTSTAGTYFIARNSEFGCAGQANNSTTLDLPITIGSPISVTASATPTSVCSGAAVSLTSSATLAAPVTLYSENFESMPDNAPLTTTTNNWLETPTNLSTDWGFSSTSAITGSRSLTLYDGAIWADYAWDAASANLIAYNTVKVNAVGYTSLKLSFKWKGYGENGFDYGMVVWSTNGTTWNNVTGTQYQLQSTAQTVTNLDLSAADNQQFYIGFKWNNDGATGAAPGFTIDDILITGLLPATCTYSWTSSPGGYSSSSQNPTANPTVGATYTVTATSGGCVGTATTSAVSIIPLPSQPSVISGVVSPCFLTTQTYSVTNVPGVTYTWSFPAGWTINSGQGTNSAVVTLSASPSTGNITVTPSIVCGNGTARTLAVSPANLAPVISGCPSDITINSEVGTCGAVVTWTPPTATDDCTTFGPGSQTFNYTGSAQTFTVPLLVTNVTANVWGAGGGGGGSYRGITGANNAAGGGGGGGGFASKSIAVSPGNNFTVTIGAGGTGGNGNANGVAGGLSNFGGLVIAGGGALGSRGNSGSGNGGVGGAGTAGAGITTFTGGTGANGVAGTSGGGGGGSAGTGSNGNPGTAGAGGIAVAGGGAGGNHGASNSSSGNPGNSPGAGGAGGRSVSFGSNANGGAGADGRVIVSWNIPAVTQTAGPVSGSVFPVGTTVITYTSTDAVGAVSTCSFNVIVVDNQPPSIATNSDLVTCSSNPLLTPPTVSDNCSGIGAVTNNAPGTFSAGTTVVTWSVTDGAGNTSTSNQNVFVINNAIPASVATATGATLTSGDLLWSGNSSTAWGSNTNWYAYNGTAFVVPGAGIAPTANDRVFVLPSSTSGICVSGSNNTTVTASGIAKDVYIGSGATMLIDAGQSLQVNGNWTNNGTFTPNATASVEFTGGTAQTIGGSSANNFTNMTLNKSASSLTLNSPVNVTGTLTMTAGNIATSGANILTIGTSPTAIGSIVWTDGTVIGPLKRWFANGVNSTQASGIFPVGLSNKNRYAQVNYSGGLSTGGSITAEYISGVCPVGYAGLPYSVDGQMIQNYENEGYWSITPTGGDLNTAAYSLTLRGNTLSTVTSPVDMLKLRIIKSTSHTSWEMSGIGSNAGTIGGVSDFSIANTGMTGFSFFNIGSGNANPLPVSMLDFSANCNDKSEVDVKWTTASEQNSEYFTVERSRNLAQWEFVTTTNAAGNSDYNIDYATSDSDPFSDVSYYRLVQVDNNGVESIYGPVSVACSDAENSMIVFPNPTRGVFTVEVFSTSEIANSTLQVTDISGKVIANRVLDLKVGKNQVFFNELGLQLGTYIISIQDSDNQIRPIRVVVN